MRLRGGDMAYDLEAAGEVSSILSNFSTDFIFDSIDTIMEKNKELFDLRYNQNFVDELELSFKEALDRFPSQQEDIQRVRNQSYQEIIKRISQNTGVQIIYEPSGTDLRYLASAVFDLFVANYHNYVFNFLYNFIMEQKEAIYSDMKLEKSKRVRDVSTIYNKEMFDDQHLAIINANLVKVLTMISAMDLPTNEVLRLMAKGSYNSQRVYDTIRFLDPNIDLFHLMVYPVLTNENTFPSLVSLLNVEIQKSNSIQDKSLITGEKRPYGI